MVVPCKSCPFRKDVKPFLHPKRGEELALLSLNPYNTFPCHKTTEYCEVRDETVVTENSKHCAGFLTLQALNHDRALPDGFVPSFDLVYEDVEEMIAAYNNKNNY